MDAPFPLTLILQLQSTFSKDSCVVSVVSCSITSRFCLVFDKNCSLIGKGWFFKNFKNPDDLIDSLASKSNDLGLIKLGSGILTGSPVPAWPSFKSNTGPCENTDFVLKSLTFIYFVELF